jgi:predicted phage terminase large subunit-like protein
MDLARGQWSFTETCKQIRALVQQYPDTGPILVEKAANGAAVIDALQHQMAGILGVTPQGSKVSRAQAASISVEAKQIWLPNPRLRGQLLRERAWVEAFLDECCQFPRGKHDDQVDAFTQVVAKCVAESRDDNLFQGLTW